MILAKQPTNSTGDQGPRHMNNVSAMGALNS